MDYYLLIGDEQSGPLTPARVRSLLATLPSDQESWIWCEGMADWQDSVQWLLDSSSDAVETYEVADNSSTATIEAQPTDYFVLRGEDTLGPWSESDLVARLQAGEFQETDLLFQDGMADWSPVGDLFTKAPTPTRLGWLLVCGGTVLAIAVSAFMGFSALSQGNQYAETAARFLNRGTPTQADITWDAWIAMNRAEIQIAKTPDLMDRTASAISIYNAIAITGADEALVQFLGRTLALHNRRLTTLHSLRSDLSAIQEKYPNLPINLNAIGLPPEIQSEIQASVQLHTPDLKTVDDEFAKLHKEKTAVGRTLSLKYQRPF